MKASMFKGFKTKLRYYLLVSGSLFFAPSFTGYFGIDDFRIIPNVAKRLTTPESFTNAFLTRYLSEALAFDVFGNMFGVKAVAYHILANILHEKCAYLVSRIILINQIRNEINAKIIALFSLLHSGTFSVIFGVTPDLNEPLVAF